MIARILALAAVTATTLAFPATSPAQQPVAPSAEKKRMIALGVEHKTPRALYEHFKQTVNNGQALTWASVPDWTGIWTREASPFLWDPDQGSPTALPTAKLTPEHERLLRDKLDKIGRGIEFDPLSNCEPAGMPRWLVEPFLKEFVVTPAQTYLINEMQNEIRRPRSYERGRRLPALGRRLDRFLGRRQARDSHEPNACRSVPAHSAVLHGTSRNRRNLAKNRPDDHGGRRLGVRPACSGGALVH